MSKAINAGEIAQKIGYTIPLTEFGVARWESSEGFAFITASGDGNGGLGVHVGHMVDGGEEVIGTLIIGADGKTQSSWLGATNIHPVVVLEKVLSAHEIMGNPVFIDSPEMV